VHPWEGHTFLIVRKTQALGLGLLAFLGPATAAPATRTGEHRFSNPEAVFPLAHAKENDMSTNTPQTVCRLLGGSGRAPLVVVPTVKIPALLAPTRPKVAEEFPERVELPLAA